MKKLVLSIFSSLFVTAALAAEATQPETAPNMQDQGFTQTLIMISVALLFFYFILWRPEQKRKKAMDEQRNTMKKGDKAIAMGIIGTVYKVADDSVTLKMCDGNKIEFVKAAISEVTPASDEERRKAEKDN